MNRGCLYPKRHFGLQPQGRGWHGQAHSELPLQHRSLGRSVGYPHRPRYPRRLPVGAWKKSGGVGSTLRASPGGLARATPRGCRSGGASWGTVTVWSGQWRQYPGHPIAGNGSHPGCHTIRRGTGQPRRVKAASPSRKTSPSQCLAPATPPKDLNRHPVLAPPSPSPSPASWA